MKKEYRISRAKKIIREKCNREHLSLPPRFACKFAKHELAYIGKHHSKPFGDVLNKFIEKLIRRK